MTIPPALAAAIAEYHRQRTTRHEHRPPTLAPGELVTVAAHDGLCRIALITRNFDRWIEIALASNAIEMATQVDLVLAYADTGYPTTLLFEGELYGQVWPSQVTAAVGNVSIENTVRLRRLLRDEGGDGTVLQGLSDPRRQFKEDELTDLTRIVADCRRTLLEEFRADEQRCSITSTGQSAARQPTGRAGGPR